MKTKQLVWDVIRNHAEQSGLNHDLLLKIGGPARTRTENQSIMSALL
jgi:hypothetical protein